MKDLPDFHRDLILLHGPSGAGKTWRLGQITRRHAALHPGARIQRSTGESLIELMMAAAGSKVAFENLMPDPVPDLVVVDDLDTTRNRVVTRQAIARVLRSLLAGGSRLVVTQREPPPAATEDRDELDVLLAEAVQFQLGSPGLGVRLSVVRERARVLGADLGWAGRLRLALPRRATAGELAGLVNREVAFRRLEGGRG